MAPATACLTWRRDGYELSTDPRRVDRALVHRFLSEHAYWSPGIPRAVVERAVDHSIVFGLYHGNEQIGFARVVTDRATFAYLADVFVLPEHRGNGLSVWMMERISAHPDLQGLRRWMLATRDAHGLYEKFGFEPLGNRAAIFMERLDPEVYGKGHTAGEEGS